jgi:hypothetical protein
VQPTLPSLHLSFGAFQVCYLGSLLFFFADHRIRVCLLNLMYLAHSLSICKLALWLGVWFQHAAGHTLIVLVFCLFIYSLHFSATSAEVFPVLFCAVFFSARSGFASSLCKWLCCCNWVGACVVHWHLRHPKPPRENGHTHTYIYISCLGCGLDCYSNDMPVWPCYRRKANSSATEALCA